LVDIAYRTITKVGPMTFPPSDHFNGKTFFNPGEPSGRGLADLIKWKMTGHPVPWPARVPVVPRPVPPAPTGDGVTATWVGHSTFVLRTAGATILTDPMFSERASPVSWLGPRRAAAPGVDFAALPRVDIVLLSHDHFDHCDLPSLRRVARRDNPLAVSPLGHRTLLEGAGFTRIAELDWWEDCACGAGTEVTLVPARHWSRRSPFGTNTRLWGGFMVRSGGRRVYFVGDSGYDGALFTEIGRRCGRPDLALIPIGAYEPRWFMKDAHMNPAEAVRVHREVGARRSLAMHWGTFQLTDEGREEPLRALEAARAPGDAFAALAPGESAAA
jgi:L-ascorbate metabolism protein UlaG (beta-lactamase superfamily)